MKTQNQGTNRLDDLLKQVLKDDLPGETEAAMKRRLNSFREKMESAEQQSMRGTDGIWARLFKGLEPTVRRMLLKQVLPALASILLIVMGSLMQMNNGQNVLAESVTVWNASIHTVNQILYNPTMSCSVDTLTGEKKGTIYRIEWLDADHSRVQVHGRVKTVKGIENIDDPVFRLVLHLLSPTELVKLLDGKWMLKEYSQESECKLGTFDVINPGEKIHVEITTDLCTCLPVSMQMSIPSSSKKEGNEDILLNIRFKWNPPVSPRLPKDSGSRTEKLITK